MAKPKDPEVAMRYRLLHRVDVAAYTRAANQRRVLRSRFAHPSKLGAPPSRIGLSGLGGGANEHVGVVMRNYEEFEFESVVDFSANGPTGGLFVPVRHYLDEYPWFDRLRKEVEEA